MICHVINKKLIFTAYDIVPERPPVTTIGGTELKEVRDLKLLGSRVNSTQGEEGACFENWCYGNQQMCIGIENIPSDICECSQ